MNQLFRTLKPLLCAAALAAVPARADVLNFLETVDSSLFVQTPNGFFRTDLSGLVDLEGYYIDQRPPGLIGGGSPSFVNPRLSVFLDAHLGQHLYSFVEGRFDRGFDPRSDVRAARFDQYLLRYTPFDEPVLNLQIGKFATVVGSWASRADSWNNPFINAPVPYENVFVISDRSAPVSLAAFLARRDKPDNKELWRPIIWGPSYTSGGSVFGTINKLDYALEVKNGALSARPESWDGQDIGWDNPSVDGRIAYRPSLPWTIGASFGYGTYLRPEAASAPGFPAGKSIGDYDQITIGGDLGFAWHHWQFWAELYLARFQVPNVGDADTLAYYLEAKYKFNTHLYGALRWNQQFFGDVSDGHGGQRPWDRDMMRVDAALGYRFSRHLQTKLQYSFSDQRGPLQQGQQLVAGQLTLKF